jgi:hypothetical protein
MSQLRGYRLARPVLSRGGRRFAMTTTRKLSLSLVAALAVAAGTPAARAAEPSVHLGLVPFGGEHEIDVRGVSFSLIADRVGRFSGVQLAPGIAQTLQSSSGVQLSGVANVVSGDLRGVQVTGALNMTDGGVRGVQLAGGVNVAGRAAGLQLAPVNIAGDTRGVQLGVANVAWRQARGLQVGVVNVASRSRGLSFGLVNVAREHDGEALGLLNFIGNGIHDVAVYSTDTMLTNASVKLGGRHLYTSYSFGYTPGDTVVGRAGPDVVTAGDRRLGVGLGIGYRFDLDFGWLQFIELEATGMAVQPELDFSDDDVPLLTAARVIVGIDLSPELTLIAGVTENVSIDTNGRDLDLQRGGLEQVMRSGNTTVRMYPGLLLGLQL